MARNVNQFYPLNPCYGITKPMDSGKKLFPLHPGPGLCVPKGFCIICHQMFIEIEPVGYVKPKKGSIGYYHTRCMRGDTK